MWMIINQNQDDYRDPPSMPAESRASCPSRHTEQVVNLLWQVGDE